MIKSSSAHLWVCQPQCCLCTKALWNDLSGKPKKKIWLLYCQILIYTISTLMNSFDTECVTVHKMRVWWWVYDYCSLCFWKNCAHKPTLQWSASTDMILCLIACDFNVHLSFHCTDETKNSQVYPALPELNKLPSNYFGVPPGGSWGIPKPDEVYNLSSVFLIYPGISNQTCSVNLQRKEYSPEASRSDSWTTSTS